MGWSLLVRWLVRLAASLFAWRLATARRATYSGNMPPVRPPARTGRIDPRAAVATLREGASITWRVTSAGVAAVAAALLITGGVTLTVLSPRWLGISLLVLAVLALAFCLLEVRVAAALVLARRRRQHDSELRRQLS